MQEQCSSAIMMVRPEGFRFDEQTAANNSFQQEIAIEGLQAKACAEFDDLVAKIESHGIEVHVMRDGKTNSLPDAVFPNNWVSFHQDGRVVLYPMYAPIRRAERDEEMLHQLRRNASFTFHEIMDYSGAEELNLFLEGTGSMVLDRQHKLAYMCRSERSSVALLNDFCTDFNYKAFSFDAKLEKENGEFQSVYHTNVLLSVGENFAVLCSEIIDNKKELLALRESLEDSGKEIVEITTTQLLNFCGNVIELKNKDGAHFVVMSSKAYHSFTVQQQEVLRKYAQIIHAPIETIEQIGGGSVRCMIAEVFLTKKHS